jgi:F-box/leucine-rich repeat protein 2/20
MDAFGFANFADKGGKVSPLRVLRISGLKGLSTDLMVAVAKAFPHLEVLNLSFCRGLTDSAIEAFITPFARSDCPTITLTSRQMGFDPADQTLYTKRLTRLRHLSVSSCPLLTDTACAHLAYAVPDLEFFEMAGIGSAVRSEGLVAMLKTTPKIRRLDLEDACEITDDILEVLTPPPPPDTLPTQSASAQQQHLHPGMRLEHLVLSYATHITSETLTSLIHACPRLTTLEVDNTRISENVVKEFVRISRERKLKGAEIIAVDCRGVGKSILGQLTDMIRPRRGWRDWGSRNLMYTDGRDESEKDQDVNLTPGGPGTGQDECDESRVVMKCFWSWQGVDATLQARERKRRLMASRRHTTGARGRGEADDGTGRGSRGRWWSARGSPVTSGTSSPTGESASLEDRGCTIM